MNAEQARVIANLVTATIESEAATTRKVIANVPNKTRDYKPDDKSRTAWELATHIATSDIWFADSILKGQFEFTGEPPLPPEFTDSAAVAKWHEKQLADRLAKLRALPGDALAKDVEFFTMKGPNVHWMLMWNNHHIHHRGQLAAYLRAMGSKVPNIYGPSADAEPKA